MISNTSSEELLAREYLALAHEEAKKPLVAVDIRTGNIGRPAGVVWVDTKIALSAIAASLRATAIRKADNHG